MRRPVAALRILPGLEVDDAGTTLTIQDPGTLKYYGSDERCGWASNIHRGFTDSGTVFSTRCRKGAERPKGMDRTWRAMTG